MFVELDDIANRQYQKHDETRKPRHYFAAYQELFSSLRTEEVAILELGVRKAGSINVWREYFQRAIIVGLDIEPRPIEFPSDTRCYYVQGNQADPIALAEACAIVPKFDIVIDDASHIGILTKQSFAYLFTKALKPGGIYVLEDYGAALAVETWPDAHPYERQPDSGNRFPSYDYAMLGFLKQLIDNLIPKASVEFPIARVDIRPGVAFVWKQPTHWVF